MPREEPDMLPDRLLSFDRTADARLLPRWLGPRDDVWLVELVAEARAAAGATVGEVDDRLVDTVARRAHAHGVGRRTVEAVWLVEQRRWRSVIDATVPPERVRRVVFDRAAERGRDEGLLAAASELGLPATEILRVLFADRAQDRRFVAPATEATPQDLRERYNLALAQSLVVRSIALVASVRGHARNVVSFAKLLRLMVVFEETADGVLRIGVSGPLSLFHDTTKYGRALAMWLPALVATPEWRLDSRVVVRGETLVLALDATAPIARTQKLPRAFDSKLEARLDRDLRRLRSRWRVERESEVIRVDRRLFFPDFSLIAEDGCRVAVEVAGFWTPGYLADKLRLLESANRPFVLCLDRRHADRALSPRPNVVLFDGHVDAAALVDACATELARFSSGTAPRRHWLTLPESTGLARYAVLAGARAVQWREDLLADLAVAGIVRLGIRGSRRFLVGEHVAAEVVVDGSRRDALFVHRVIPRAGLALDAEHRVAVTLCLRRPGEPSPPADPVPGNENGRLPQAMPLPPVTP